MIYKESLNWYELCINYFQYSFSKKMLAAEPEGLENLSDVIHNNILCFQNIIKEQVFDLNFFKYLADHAIIFKQYICKNYLSDKICFSDQTQGYNVISLKDMNIEEISEMLREKDIDEQVIMNKIPSDLWSEIEYFDKMISFLGETIEN